MVTDKGRTRSHGRLLRVAMPWILDKADVHNARYEVSAPLLRKISATCVPSFLSIRIPAVSQ